MKIDTIQPKIKNCNDSFFYDGQIATIETKNWIYSLEAQGEIKIYHTNSKGEAIGMHNGYKSYDNFPLNLKDDKALAKVGNEYTDKYYWEMNNWFEVIGINKKTKEAESAMCDVVWDYDEAIEMLKNYAREDYYETNQ
jgi:hypothetical protein